MPIICIDLSSHELYVISFACRSTYDYSTPVFISPTINSFTCTYQNNSIIFGVKKHHVHKEYISLQ